MFNRIYQTLSDAGLKSYGWDGFGYKDYSIRFSNFSRNLNNIKQTYNNRGFFAAGTALLFLDGALAEERGTLCFNYLGDFSQHIGFSSLDEKANYIIMQYNCNLVPFYPRGIAALCNINYNASRQDRSIRQPYEVLAVSGFSVTHWTGHTAQACNAWQMIEAKFCGDKNNPVYVEIENCLKKVIDNTVMQAQLICNENEPKAEIKNYLICAASLVATCTAGYAIYSFFRNRNAAPIPVAAPVIAPAVTFGQEDDAPRTK